MVEKILELIREQVGLDLEVCDCFTGIRECAGQLYFNVVLKQRTSESREFDLLQRFANQYGLIRIEPNGLNRVAIFLTGL